MLNTSPLHSDQPAWGQWMEVILPKHACRLVARLVVGTDASTDAGGRAVAKRLTLRGATAIADSAVDTSCTFAWSVRGVSRENGHTYFEVGNSRVRVEMPQVSSLLMHRCVDVEFTGEIYLAAIVGEFAGMPCRWISLRLRATSIQAPMRAHLRKLDKNSVIYEDMESYFKVATANAVLQQMYALLRPNVIAHQHLGNGALSFAAAYRHHDVHVHSTCVEPDGPLNIPAAAQPGAVVAASTVKGTKRPVLYVFEEHISFVVRLSNFMGCLIATQEDIDSASIILLGVCGDLASARAAAATTANGEKLPIRTRIFEFRQIQPAEMAQRVADQLHRLCSGGSGFFVYKTNMHPGPQLASDISRALDESDDLSFEEAVQQQCQPSIRPYKSSSDSPFVFEVFHDSEPATEEAGAQDNVTCGDRYKMTVDAFLKTIVATDEDNAMINDGEMDYEGTSSIARARMRAHTRTHA